MKSAFPNSWSVSVHKLVSSIPNICRRADRYASGRCPANIFLVARNTFQVWPSACGRAVCHTGNSFFLH
jgi:hypothetical protein